MVEASLVTAAIKRCKVRDYEVGIRKGSSRAEKARCSLDKQSLGGTGGRADQLAGHRGARATNEHFGRNRS